MSRILSRWNPHFDESLRNQRFDAYFQKVAMFGEHGISAMLPGGITSDNHLLMNSSRVVCLPIMVGQSSPLACIYSELVAFLFEGFH